MQSPSGDRPPGRGAKEVSCLSLTFFFDYLDAHGIERSRLIEGLPYSAEHLHSRLGWIDYRTFLEIEARLAGLFPEDPELFFNIGKTFAETQGLGFLRVLLRAVVSPVDVYYRIPGHVKKFLFPFLTIRFERPARDRLIGHYSFEPGYPPSDAFIETVRGMLTGAPVIVGAPPAQVRAQRSSESELRFHIRFRTEWLGVLDYVRRGAGRVMSTVRMQWRTLGDAAAELEETNLLLQEKVDDLAEAKTALDRKVRDLSILHALSRAVASELDPGRLVRSSVFVISGELGQIPVAILMSEGDPPSLVMAASAGIDAGQRRSFDVLADPASKATARVVSSRGASSLPVGDESWTVLPLLRADRFLGALVLGEQARDFETALLWSAAAELAVAVDNALSYQVIADLRDHLELRVQERTAELEVARGKLEDTVMRLERADRAKSEFFTNVSHELKTPLTLILGPLDDLAGALATGGREEDLDNVDLVRRNALNLLRLVEEILDSARIDEGRMPLSLQDVELVSFSEDLAVSLRPLAERAGVSLRCAASGGPLEVEADRKLLRRAVVNLVVNAINYCQEGDAITLRVGADRRGAVVEVVDTGPGIPQDQQDRIFERFQRVSDASGRIVEGSGIGLSMVKGIAELHRGTLELESEVGRGSVFRVLLPAGSEVALSSRDGASPPGPTAQGDDPEAAADGDLVQDAAAAAAWIPPLRRAAEEVATGPPAAGRVLLVEDDPEMRGFLTRVLRRHHRVLATRDGQEALERTRSELPDVILSDVMMPRLDGFAMCRALKSDPATRSIPVVLISARHGTEAAIEAFDAGADDFIVKPFAPRELLARVGAQMRIRTLTIGLIRAEKQSTLGIMSAGIAHEVLNPVNAVVGAVPPLRKHFGRLREAGGAAGDYEICDALLDAIERSGHRITEVVNAILTFARRDDGELQLKEGRLGERIESALAILSYRLDDRTTVHRDYRWDEPTLCYPALLGQAVMNLITNALDAVRERPGSVWVTTDRVGDDLRVCVRDDGPGIPPGVREQIFTPFCTTKPPGSGTGLGLAIAREIVQLHNGSLELRAGGDAGAEFVLTLPYLDPIGRSSRTYEAGSSRR